MPRPDGENPCLLCGSEQFDPAIDEISSDFGLRLIGENRLAAAYEYLEGLVARGEESAGRCHRLAWLAYAFGDFRAVEIWSHETLRLDEDMPEAHLLLGLALQRAGRWAEAVEEYSAGLTRAGALPHSRVRLESLLQLALQKIPEY
jgi:tetratricopeptide (TPR) repeat protein